MGSLNALMGRKIVFVGGGNMAEAMIRGILQPGVLDSQNIVVTGRRSERLKELEERYGVCVSLDNGASVAQAHLIVLSVKPQILGSVLKEVASQIPESALVVSIAAGYPLELIERHLQKGVQVCRGMPNIAAVVDASASGVFMGKHVGEKAAEMGRSLFEAIGTVVEVDEEGLLDAVTGLSGSGPAYVFLIIEALSDAGVKMGLPRRHAQNLAAQTMLGSVRLALETGEHPGVLKDRVTSPGGTAIAGLHTLEDGGLRTTLMNAVAAATMRCRELTKALLE